MAANDMTFNQVATVLNSIQQMVTGQSENIVTEGDFATVAQTVLKTGYENVYKAISMVLGRTIFSIRPYTRKFKGLERTDGQFKMHTRKIQMADTPFEDNDTVKYPVHFDTTQNPQSGDGQSVDQQIIKKADIIQTNFYGMNTYQDHYTLFDEQLDVAFSNSSELGRFIQMVTMNVNNKFEQARESFARMCLVNYIASLYDNSHVISLLDEYNSATGASLTAQTVFAPENYVPFMRWAYAFIKTISDAFTERTCRYQNPIAGKNIIRHTPKENQKLFVLAHDKNNMEASVLSTTFNDEYLKGAYTEVVNFWQTPEVPSMVHFEPTYTGSDGKVTTGEMASISKVFAVLFDEEALGYSIVKSTFKAAPYNACADYQNFFLKDYQKNYMDLSEKGVLFVIDSNSWQ